MYERHPLSAEYANLSHQEFDSLKESIATIGLLRPIVLLDGMILDGWQRHLACQAQGVAPSFQEFSDLGLPAGTTPEAFVEAVNDRRRHETKEQKLARAAARRERVAQAREAGQSIRTIAESEEVSIGTVQRDIETTPGVSGDTPVEHSVEHEAKVMGKDGRKYKAKAKPKPAQAVPSQERSTQEMCSKCARMGVNPRCPCQEGKTPKPKVCPTCQRPL